MSHGMAVIENTGKSNDRQLQLTRFAGPGMEMVQLTQGFAGILPDGDPDEPGFVQLSMRDAYQVVVELTKWIKDSSREQAERMQQEIDKHTELQNTLFAEAVKCQKFIEDLDILDMPTLMLHLCQASKGDQE